MCSLAEDSVCVCRLGSEPSYGCSHQKGPSVAFKKTCKGPSLLLMCLQQGTGAAEDKNVIILMYTLAGEAVFRGVRKRTVLSPRLGILL